MKLLLFWVASYKFKSDFIAAYFDKVRRKTFEKFSVLRKQVTQATGKHVEASHAALGRKKHMALKAAYQKEKKAGVRWRKFSASTRSSQRTKQKEMQNRLCRLRWENSAINPLNVTLLVLDRVVHYYALTAEDPEIQCRWTQK